MSKKYISFDEDNEEDQKVIRALGLIERYMDLKPKDLVKNAVEKITKSPEYKKALKALFDEIQKDMAE